MNDISRTDIEQHVIYPTLGEHFTEAQLQAITDDVLAAAPLDTWRFEGTTYVTDALTDDDYWSIAFRHTA